MPRRPSHLRVLQPGEPQPPVPPVPPQPLSEAIQRLMAQPLGAPIAGMIPGIGGVLGGLGGALGGVLGGLGGALGGMAQNLQSQQQAFSQQLQQNAYQQQLEHQRAWFVSGGVSCPDISYLSGISTSLSMAPADVARGGGRLIGMTLRQALQQPEAKTHRFTVDGMGRVVAMHPARPQQAVRWSKPTMEIVPETALQREARFLREAQAEVDELAPEGTIEPPVAMSRWERLLVWVIRRFKLWSFAQV